MTIEGALIAALSASGPVTEIATGGIFLRGAEQAATYPYVSIERISTPGADQLAGARGLEWPRMQVDSWAKTGAAAAALADAIRSTIDAVQQNVGGMIFTAVFDDQRGPAPDTETLNFRASQDYHLWYGRN